MPCGVWEGVDARGAVEWVLKRREVTYMPQGDGTGPDGQGQKTGRGQGPCGRNSQKSRDQGIKDGRRGTGQGNGGAGGRGQGQGRGLGRGRGNTNNG